MHKPFLTFAAKKIDIKWKHHIQISSHFLQFVIFTIHFSFVQKFPLDNVPPAYGLKLLTASEANDILGALFFLI